MQVMTGIALVADDRLSPAKRTGQDRERDLPLAAIGPDKGGCARRAVGSTGEMQAHAPEVARVLFQ